MKLVDFGFDLAGRREPGIVRGLAWSVAAAVAEAMPYVELYRVLQALASGEADLALAVEATAVLLVCAAAAVALKARANVVTFAAIYRAAAAARLAVADRLTRLPMGAFNASRKAVIADLLGGRFTLYQDVLAQAWGLAAVNVGLPVLLWLLLVAVDWRAAFVVAVLAPPAFLAIPWAHRLLAHAAAKLADLRDEAVAAVVQQVEAAADLRTFDAGGERLQAAEALMERLEVEQMRSELAPAPALLVFGFTLNLSFATCAAIAVWFAADGNVPPATLALTLIVCLRLFRALSELGLNLAELRFANETLARIRTAHAMPALPEPAQPREPVDASVVFDHVCFTYPGAGACALVNISGDVPAGRTVALVGPSGAGKSTLAHLIGRLWDVESGAVRIGGADVRDMAAATRARTVAMVLQEVSLFEGTIADNIRLGRPEASDVEVEAAARAARAHEFILDRPGGYQACLGGGADLSGGERQRIAIARALLKNAPVLVLDEATASVDLDEEAEIQAALSELVRGRTVVVIAHRLWTVAGADQIWVLCEGEVVERGGHDDLLARPGGLYRALWTAQADPS